MTKAKAKTKAKPYAPPTSWDYGATGPANRVNLIEEPATEFDPRTGRVTPNPNNVRRVRRQPWVRIYGAQGLLTPAQVAAAEALRLASEGLRERDPLAAIVIDRTRGGDPQAARLDARRLFWAMWDHIPQASRPVVERVALDDCPIWHGNPAQRDRHIQRLATGLDAIS
jgi:hypothetical protein